MNININLIGHDNSFNNLVQLYNKNILPNKIIIKGNKGIGKFLLCSHFVNYVLSQDEEYKYNLNKFEINIKNKSYQLFKNEIHPNINIINKKKDSRNIEISQIREMFLFQNTSSFNNKHRFIVINNVSNLNNNSTNALLKSIEEPNKNVFYILTYNTGTKILDTLRSRCVEFKLTLQNKYKKMIVDNYFKENIYDLISTDFANFYTNPSFLISLINYSKVNSLDYTNLTIEDLIIFLINNKDYVKNNFINENINVFIELFFYKNINVTNKITYKIKEYFYLKLSEIKKYNLDMESYFLEFQNQLLNE